MKKIIGKCISGGSHLLSHLTCNKQMENKQAEKADPQAECVPVGNLCLSRKGDVIMLDAAG